MPASAFVDAHRFRFLESLERGFAAIRAELEALEGSWFEESPDSLTTKRDGYDETGWYACALKGDGARPEVRERCPETVRLCEALPSLVNASFSLLRPGTHLYPHRGHLEGVLRCHLPVVVPPGEVGIRFGAEVRRWEEGRCLVFDDTFEHEAWNHGDGDRVVLLVTFRPEG